MFRTAREISLRLEELFVRQGIILEKLDDLSKQMEDGGDETRAERLYLEGISNLMNYGLGVRKPDA